jgi:cell division protein FtsB
MLSASAADWIARIRSQGLTWVLAAAIVLLQYPLWLGEGGWLKVREACAKDRHPAGAEPAPANPQCRLLAELGDLKQGRDAIEERARNELGMIAPDEWFVRVVSAHPVQSGKVNE